MLADDISFQGEGQPKVVATATVADLVGSPYRLLAEPEFINPVPVLGLGGKVIGFANLSITGKRYLVADLYFNYETEERLLLDNGESLWTEMHAPHAEIDASGWSWNRGIRILKLPVEALKVTQRPSSLWPMIRVSP
jgi:hypothetical protein